MHSSSDICTVIEDFFIFYVEHLRGGQSALYLKLDMDIVMPLKICHTI